MSPDYIALLERLHEARCAEIKANRLAGLAAVKAHVAEQNYAWACWQVRDLERQLEIMRGNHVFETSHK